MWEKVSDELARKTQSYWRLSSVRNGRQEERIEFWEASEILQTIQQSTNYVRPIFQAADRLMQELIAGRIEPSAKTEILTFARKS